MSDILDELRARIASSRSSAIEVRAANEIAKLRERVAGMVPADWDGLLRILDDRYSVGVFDGSSGDPGPRIVVLLREIERLRGLLRDANDAFDECTRDYPKELVEGEPWREFASAESGSREAPEPSSVPKRTGAASSAEAPAEGTT